MQTIQQVAHRISRARHILIICHVAPDGDAIGSLLGLGLALCEQGKQVCMVCSDEVPEAYRHLPQWQEITSTPQGDFDLLISVDCGDLERLGRAFDREKLSGISVINIDHHTTNACFGEINWIDTESAATAQMLVRLLHTMKIPISYPVATCLLNGILTDTLGFRTSNTTADVMKTAVELIQAGASLHELTNRIFNHRPLAVVRLWTACLNNLQLQNRILWTQITPQMRAETGYYEHGDAGLGNFLSTVSEADIAVVFDERTDGQVNVSIRAGLGYNVSRVALSLGGGGHPQAAGCTLPGALDTVRNVVLERLEQAWNEQTLARQAHLP